MLVHGEEFCARTALPPATPVDDILSAVRTCGTWSDHRYAAALDGGKRNILQAGTTRTLGRTREAWTIPIAIDAARMNPKPITRAVDRA